MTFDDNAFFIEGRADGRPVGCSGEKALRVRSLLKKLGVKLGSKGFRVLEDAVVYSLECEDVYGRLTKEIYPAVARKRRQSEASVEKACRDSVKRCWRQGDREMISGILGGAPRVFRGEPTVCEFLTAVKDYLDEAA